MMLKRTAKSCGSDAPMLASSLREEAQATVSNKPGHRGDHEVRRKTIARGCRVISGEPVVTMLGCLFLSAPRLRVHRAPGIPCALCFIGRNFFARPRAYRAARMRTLGLEIGATSLRGANGSRECAPDDRLRDEAIHPFFAWRHGLLRFARNDG